MWCCGSIRQKLPVDEAAGIYVHPDCESPCMEFIRFLLECFGAFCPKQNARTTCHWMWNELKFMCEFSALSGSVLVARTESGSVIGWNVERRSSKFSPDPGHFLQKNAWHRKDKNSNKQQIWPKAKWIYFAFHMGGGSDIHNHWGRGWQVKRGDDSHGEGVKK